MAMKIAGLQKVSTVDYPGEICCVVFLHGCNFRCGFCYNPDLVVKECEGAWSSEYVLSFLSRRKGKLDAVCISGGEPLMSLDLDFLKKIKEMGFKIKLDTNGSFPERLREVLDLGLVDYVAMDVKGAKDDYESIVDVVVDFAKIEESMKIVNAFSSKDDPTGPGGEFRTTVVPGIHDVDNLVKMGDWMERACGTKPGKMFLQGFKRNKEGMIDPKFLEKDDCLEGELFKIKKRIDWIFGEVGVRF